MKLLKIHGLFFIYTVLSLQIVYSFALSLDSDNISYDHNCPIWTLPQVKRNESDDAECVCKNYLYNALLCDQNSLDIRLLLFHCMTYSLAFNTTVVGNCLYNVHGRVYPYRNYWLLLRREVESRNDTVLCGFIESFDTQDDYNVYQHQTGQMCSSCTNGYGYPV